MKKLYNEIFKKFTKAKTNDLILELQYNFNEVWKEMKKVESELKNENFEKNKNIYVKNQILSEEINNINKNIKLKSKKIEKIKSGQNYINKYINKRNISAKLAEEEEKYHTKINKSREEYIKYLKLIERNKNIINKNEEEIKNLKEEKKILMETNYELAQNQEKNEEIKKKLKNLREK